MADKIKFNNIERTMYRWRKETKLPKLNSYSQVCQVLYQEEWEFLRGYSLNLNDPQKLTVDHGSNEVLNIYDSELLENLNAENFYISSSAKIVPQLANSKLLTTIIAEVNNYVSISICKSYYN